MSQGEVKNAKTDQRVGNKSGHQGRPAGSKNRSSSRQDDSMEDSER